MRIGNAAYGQTQLDIFGELIDAVYLANKYGNAIAYEGWQRAVCVLDWVCEHWRDPDQASGRRVGRRTTGCTRA